jgi:hypothetical protein
MCIDRQALQPFQQRIGVQEEENNAGNNNG